jgi:hypothetical protein
MSEHKIVPEKVTKPIQLLAAWLVGLILIDTAFLVAAGQISQPTWAAGLLVIAAVVNVPLFITALFLLQTKFRPQMQEDSYYAAFLAKDYESLRPVQSADTKAEVVATAKKLVQRLGPGAAGQEGSIEDVLTESAEESLMHKHANVRSLSELYLQPETWELVVKEYAEDKIFQLEMQSLIKDGLVELPTPDLKSVCLTDLGRRVAVRSESNKLLFAQQNKDTWGKMRKNLIGKRSSKPDFEDPPSE